jgi:hypothetical protein
MSETLFNTLVEELEKDWGWNAIMEGDQVDEVR